MSPEDRTTITCTPCEYRSKNRKRVPVSYEYVASLESRISWLETFREEMLNSTAAAMEGKDHSTPSSFKHAQEETQEETRMDEADRVSSSASISGDYISHLGIHARSSANLELGLEGSLIYHGVTSIFRADLPYSSFKDPPDSSAATTTALLRGGGIESNFESVMRHSGIDGPSSPTVLQSLIQFFRWKYLHFMFIYREAFLRDHFSKDGGDDDELSRKPRKYWSPALLLSICALGALVNLQRKATSERFFLTAKSIIMVTGLTKPSVATVKAFLCLALYEIGGGADRTSLLGIAFHMAQDLALQRDLKGWVRHDSSIATPEDVEIRRRIYWDCYISDKLFSLIIGQPVHLVYDDAEVQPMETLPLREPPQMNLWRPIGFDEEYRESAKASFMIPYLHEQIRLSRIIERIMSTLLSPRSNLDDLRRGWHKWGGSSSKTILGVLALQYVDLPRCVTIVRIALNYDQAIASRGCDADEKPQSYCVTSAQHITSLVHTYRSHYGLQHATLVFVYGAVQGSHSAKTFSITEESQYLIQMLGELSSAWSLSREVMAKVLDC
ncbi:fungal-specific transcription factor domain-containing protein [Colletotrichum godetiae]|uniref:Fungal-specific transcription factor domain-containing protein n=1 Tax=Colletotrichum godetiae TaxID=1209918 RepID=A0AAJ0AK92_9PEZI|nr:fungal-specific transcription factor domain-containing protein [Colletotrichum godetiae]KAK1675431.1 fungal-specific transcription factor domain-containing protein [Colletotrichum godetiae]